MRQVPPVHPHEHTRAGHRSLHLGDERVRQRRLTRPGCPTQSEDRPAGRGGSSDRVVAGVDPAESLAAQSALPACHADQDMFQSPHPLPATGMYFVEPVVSTGSPRMASFQM